MIKDLGLVACTADGVKGQNVGSVLEDKVPALPYQSDKWFGSAVSSHQCLGWSPGHLEVSCILITAITYTGVFSDPYPLLSHRSDLLVNLVSLIRTYSVIQLFDIGN